MTLTKQHYKGDLARSFGQQHDAEAHFDLPTARFADAVCADDDFRKNYRFLQMLKVQGTQVLIRGATQRDVDLAVGFLQGRHSSSTAYMGKVSLLRNFPIQASAQTLFPDVRREASTRIGPAPLKTCKQNTENYKNA